MSLEKSSAWSLIESMPVALAVFLAVVGMCIELFLLTNSFQTIPVILFAVPLGLVASRILIKRFPRRLPGSIQERRTIGLLVLIAASVWSIANMYFASETVYIYKDPGIYSVTAKHLTESDNLQFEQTNVFGERYRSWSAGFDERPDYEEGRLYGQAPHLLPGFLGFLGRIFGDNGIFLANSIFGAGALLSVYGYGRMVMRPRWALFAVGGLSLSLPMIYFSRDTYTEPLTMLFAFGAMSLTLIASKHRDHRILWLISGLVAGIGVTLRVDSYIILAAILLATIVLNIQAKKQTLRRKFENVGLFGIGAAAAAIIGWFDLVLLSQHYFRVLRDEIWAQLAVLIAILIIGSLVMLFEERKHLIEALASRCQFWLPRLVSVVVIIFFLAMFSRPLWLETHKTKSYNNRYIAALQEQQGLEVDGSRYYAEYTTHWIIWYLGIFTAILGVIGVAIVGARFMRGKQFNFTPLLAATAAMLLLYGNNPRITPDHIWASRRFLPIVFPAILLFAMYSVARFYENKHLFSREVRAIAALIVALLVFLGPLQTSRGFLRHVENRDMRIEMARICGSIPDDAALIAAGGNSINMTMSIRTFCDVDVERKNKLSKEDLMIAYNNAAELNLKPFVITVGYEYGALPAGSEVTTISYIEYTEIERVVEQPPRQIDTLQRTIFISEVTPGGDLIRPVHIDERLRDEGVL